MPRWSGRGTAAWLPFAALLIALTASLRQQARDIADIDAARRLVTAASVGVLLPLPAGWLTLTLARLGPPAGPPAGSP